MSYVSLGLLPSQNRPADFETPNGPSPEAHNRLGSFIGPMSASFQLKPPESPVKGDLETAELYERESPPLPLSSSEDERPDSNASEGGPIRWTH